MLSQSTLQIAVFTPRAFMVVLLYLCGQLTGMEKYTLVKNIHVFGVEVKSFPLGIQQAFEKLIAMLPEGEDRPCFGLSRMKEDGDILYIAAIEQKEKDEAAKNQCSEYVIEKGDYLTETLTGWMSQLDAISGCFDRLMKHEEAASETWCIEWYKSNREMMCMLKSVDK